MDVLPLLVCEIMAPQMALPDLLALSNLAGVMPAKVLGT